VQVGDTLLPNAFVGSSREGLRYAHAIAKSLKHQFNVTLWNKPGTFEPSGFTLESLIAFTDRYDYGLFVFTADDIVKYRGKKYPVSRDNVIFEAGLFFGALGRENCFLFVSGAKKLRLPSDFSGLTHLPFKESRKRHPQDRHILKLVEGPCSVIRDHCKKSDRWGLNGKWKQVWSVKSKNYPKRNPSEADVAVFGSRFRAEWDVKKEGRYKLIARIGEHRMITGFWSGPHKHSYHGSCQLMVSPDSTKISGKWVGFRTNGKVESDRWEWSRPKRRA
jgi:hypothetical protein